MNEENPHFVMKSKGLHFVQRKRLSVVQSEKGDAASDFPGERYKFI